MPKKGFVLMEIITVMVIIGISAAIALPSYFTYTQQGAAKATQNNLITIYNAEKNYYLSPVGSGTYCTASCNSLTNINSMLLLNITDSNFSYACAADASGFKCTATNNSAASFKLTLTNKPLILPGGSGCESNLGANCNPICKYDHHQIYCPS